MGVWGEGAGQSGVDGVLEGDGWAGETDREEDRQAGRQAGRGTEEGLKGEGSRVGKKRGVRSEWDDGLRWMEAKFSPGAAEREAL